MDSCVLAVVGVLTVLTFSLCFGTLALSHSYAANCTAPCPHSISAGTAPLYSASAPSSRTVVRTASVIRVKGTAQVITHALNSLFSDEMTDVQSLPRSIVIICMNPSAAIRQKKHDNAAMILVNPLITSPQASSKYEFVWIRSAT